MLPRDGSCEPIPFPERVTRRTKRAKPQRQQRVPRMGVHKGSGQARVLLSGVEHYLGRAGSPEALERYASLVKEWLAAGRKPLHQAPNPVQAVLTMRSLFDQFLAYVDASGRYQKGGQPTTQRQHFAWVGNSLSEHFAGLPIAKLDEAGLVRWRDRLEGNRKRTRSGINRLVAAALYVLRWGKSRGLVPKAVFVDVAAIEPLKRGEVGDRPETGRPRRAVSAEEAARVAVHCCPQVAAMIRLQVLTGMRPGEVCRLRWADIDKTPLEGDRTGSWLYTVPAGKTSHHGHVTRYVLPPAAQRILNQFPAPPLAYVFSPAAAMAERRARMRAARKTPVQPSQLERDATARREYASCWGLNEYRHAVERACRKANVERFTPHELRHGFLTWAANTLSLGAAAAAANHRNLTTTQRYVHVRRDDELAVAAAVEARALG
ncbi:MAG: tyrosine-type recombinase/integrase [Planctomycetes bacterium]|nr:tyrosine-type recombinase/integrase [Planctomycetota bacterium]